MIEFFNLNTCIVGFERAGGNFVESCFWPIRKTVSRILSLAHIGAIRRVMHTRMHGLCSWKLKLRGPRLSWRVIVSAWASWTGMAAFEA